MTIFNMTFCVGLVSSSRLPQPTHYKECPVYIMSQQFSHIFRPLKLGKTGKVELPNRVIMGSMHVGLEDGAVVGGGLKQLAGFYAER